MAQSWLRNFFNHLFGIKTEGASNSSRRLGSSSVPSNNSLQNEVQNVLNSSATNPEAGYDPLEGLFGIIQQFSGNGTGSVLGNWINGLSGNGLTKQELLSGAYNTALSLYEYNQTQSPVAQVQQYKDAGLNPYALAGGSIVNGVPSAGSNSASSGVANPFNLLSSIANLFMRNKEISLEAKLASERLHEDQRQFDLSLEEEKRKNTAQIGLWNEDTRLIGEKILSESKNREYLQKRIETEDARLTNLNLENVILETESLMKKFDQEHQSELNVLYIRAQESEIEARKQNTAYDWARFRESQREFDKQFTLAANQFYVDSNMTLAELKMKGEELGISARELGIKEELSEAEKKTMWIKAISSAVGAAAGSYAAFGKKSVSPTMKSVPVGNGYPSTRPSSTVLYDRPVGRYARVRGGSR